MNSIYGICLHIGHTPDAHTLDFRNTLSLEKKLPPWDLSGKRPRTEPQEPRPLAVGPRCGTPLFSPLGEGQVTAQTVSFKIL